MSHVTIIGTLSDDVQLQYTSAGKPVAEFRVWEREGKGDAAIFTTFNCKAWGTLGENFAASLAKGDRVILHGSMTTEKFTTKQGEERSKNILVVDDGGPALRFNAVQVERNQRT